MKKLLILMGFLTALMADPFTAQPGTKARGMGGAFTAISNTSSAGWYNPAGTASLKNNSNQLKFITLGYNPDALEQSQFMSANNRWKATTSGIEDYYFAVGIISNQWGLSYMINNMTLVTSDSQFINESIGTFGGGYALSDSIQIGVSLMQQSIIGLYGGIDEEFSDEEDPDVIDPFTMAISLGIKFEAYKTTEQSIDIGASYRIGAASEEYTQKITTGIPDKLSLGINYNRFMGAGALSVSADYDITYIDGVTYTQTGDKTSPFGETVTTSLGAEFARPSVMIRAGYSSSDIGRTDGNNWSNEIISVGVAIPWNQNIIEGSIEKRTYDFNQAEGVEESTLLTFSVQFQN